MEDLTADDPRQIGPYLLVRRLGSGGMGRVYLGRSPSGRKVAVKVVHRELLERDPSFRSRFRREVEAAKAVGGFWTAAIVESDAEAPAPWYASAYIPGPTLHQAVRSGGPLSARAAIALGAGLSEALTAVHAAGLIHRDLKPSNVLVTDDGPRVIDFGIVRVMESGAPRTSTPDGMIVGTVGYLSPEQLLGRGPGPASDVFSLGALLVFATAAHTPFQGDTDAAVAYRTVHEPPDLTGVPSGLHRVVKHCLAKDPDVRPSVGELLRAFGDSVADAGNGRRASTPPRPTRVDGGGAGIVGNAAEPPEAAPPRVPTPRAAPPGAVPPPRRATPAEPRRVARRPEPSFGMYRADPGWTPAVAGALLVGASLAVQLLWLASATWPVAASVGLAALLLTLLVLRVGLVTPRRDEDATAATVSGCFSLIIAVVATVLLFANTDLPWWAPPLIGIGSCIALAAASAGISRVMAGLLHPASGPVATSTAVALVASGVASALFAWGGGLSAWIAVALGVIVWLVTAAALSAITASRTRSRRG